MLENMQQWALVKLLAKIFNSEALQGFLKKILTMVDHDTLKAAAFRMFRWAVFLIIICTLIDWWFYWSTPEQRLQGLRILARFRAFLKRAKTRLGLRPRTGSRGR